MMYGYVYHVYTIDEKQTYIQRVLATSGEEAKAFVAASSGRQVVGVTRDGSLRCYVANTEGELPPAALIPSDLPPQVMQ